VTHYSQAAFEEMDTERTEALVSQFKKDMRSMAKKSRIKWKTSRTQRLHCALRSIWRGPMLILAVCA